MNDLELLEVLLDPFLTAHEARQCVAKRQGDRKSVKPVEGPPERSQKPAKERHEDEAETSMQWSC